MTKAKKKTRKELMDEHFAANLPGVLSYHRLMLEDGVRNKLLYKAIKRHIRPGTSFLDVGAGTGVWAILAAKLGAKRVVAIEIEEALIPMIHKHAEENGVAGRIEIIHGKSDDVKIKGKFDVIVSELFGSSALGEDSIRSFIDLRTRFLAPGGVLIPEQLKLVAAPAYIKRFEAAFPAGLPLKSEFVASLTLNYPIPISFHERTEVKFLAEAVPLVDIEFGGVAAAPSLAGLRAEWDIKNGAKANAIITFQHSVFARDIVMNGFESQSWGAFVYRFMPFPSGTGRLSFTQNMDEKGGNWSVGYDNGSERSGQNYSPVFAFTRTRMAQQMTPYRKFNPPKAKKTEDGRQEEREGAK